MERLRSHFLISEVVGKRVPLKKKGREFGGLCPFHAEKTPSFTVNDEKGFFHCFGCGAHGDAIGFIKDYERLDYREAIEYLAREAGIPLPVLTPEETRRIEREASLYEVMEEASRWFQMQFAQGIGSEAREYLARRGITPDTVAQFRLGFAPAARDGLKRHLAQKRITDEQMIECGLIIRAEDGATFDRFRSRVMFPIRDPRGRVIAFGGRILPSAETTSSGKTLAKYVNSPETPLFHKGETLYNADQARKAAQEAGQVLVVEGNVDVVMLVQSGFANTVAPLGTAITEMHLQRLWRMGEPVLCLDGDAAGQRAMLRAAELALPLLEPDKALRFAVLPPGEDPDSLVRQRGADAMRQLIAAARPLSEMLYMHVMAAQGDIRALSPEQRASCEAQLMQHAARISNPTVRAHMRSYFSDKLWPKRGEKERKEGTSSASLASLSGEPAALLHRLEEQLLGLLLQWPSLLEYAEIEEGLARMAWLDAELNGLRLALIDYHHAFSVPDSQTLETYLSGAGLSQMAARLSAKPAFSAAKSTIVPDISEVYQAAKQILGNYELMHLEAEYREAEKALALEMNDENWQRLRELQKQIETRKPLRLFSLPEDAGR